MFAFAVLAAKPGRRLPDHLDDTLRVVEDDDVPFPIARRLRWRAEGGRVMLVAWQSADQLGIGDRWEVRPTGVTVLDGLTWVDGRPWGGRASWASQFADVLAARPLPALAPTLPGVFAAASLDARGHGTVSVDPLGMGILVRAEGDDLVVASGLPAVAARLVTSPGTEPARDLDAAAWLVYCSYVQEDRTGFAAVRRVPEGAHLVVDEGRALEVVTDDPTPWWSGEVVHDQGVADVVAATTELLGTTVELAAGAPSTRRRFELTGGHDSRTLLALALARGVEDRFSYVTWGDPGLPDREVALALAARFDLDHDLAHRPARRPAGAPGPLPAEAAEQERWAPLSLGDSIRHHVWATGGMRSALDRIRPHAAGSPNVVVCGVFGELYRSVHQRAAGVAPSRLGPLVRAGCLGRDQAHVLRRDVRADLDARVEAQVRENLVPGATLEDALDAHYLRRRLRCWFGTSAMHDHRNRVYPLLVPEAVRLAFSLGAERRRREELFFRIVRSASDDLARQPFAGAGWPEPVLAGLADAGTYPCSPLPRTWEHEGSRSRRIVRSIRRRLATAPEPVASGVVDAGAIRELGAGGGPLAELVDLGPGHPLRDIVDVDAVRKALARPAPDFGERRSLYDLVTAAVWTGHGERRAPSLDA